MTDQPTCPRPTCGKPIHDQGYVCGPCANHLRDRLLVVAALADEAETTIARLDRLGGWGSGGDPLPFSWEASDRQWAGDNTLTTWARHISEIRGVALPVPLGPMLGPPCTWTDRGCRHSTCAQTRTLTRSPQTLLAAVALWLAAPSPRPGTPSNLDWLRHRAEAEEAFDELHHACVVLEANVDTHADRWYAGPCGEGDCVQELHPLAGAKVIRCPECGTEHDAEDRKADLMARAEDQLATASWAASTLTRLGCAVRAFTVRKWAERHQLLPHGRDANNRPLYRVGEVRELALEAKRREEERTRKAAQKAAREHADQEDEHALAVAA